MSASALLNPRYGNGVVSMEDVELPPTDVEITTRLRQLFASQSWKPPMLPAVAMQLVELARKPDVEVAEVARTLETDPVLAARVLKLVQSPFYSGQTPVRSLKQAVVRLGLVGMRNAVLEASLDYRVVRAPGYRTQLEALRRHSQWTAHLARLVARRSPIDPDFCFLCGLLHDIGIAASLLALGEEREPVGIETAWSSVEEVHEEAAGIVARAWKLPVELAQVVQSHHVLRSDGQIHPVAAVICVAQELAEEIGAGLQGPAENCQVQQIETDSAERRALAKMTLRLDDYEMNSLRADTKALVKRTGEGA